MYIYVALLRGINVGGHTKVSMAELKLGFEGLGFTNVKTYINSGNVVFTSDKTDARAIEITIETMLDATFTPGIKVVVRSYDEMKALMKELPESWAVDADLRCNVIFLRHSVDNAGVLDGIPIRLGVEELAYCPGALLWSAQTSNINKSTVRNIIGTPIYKEMTIRNLNTTRKLFTIMQELSAAQV